MNFFLFFSFYIFSQKKMQFVLERSKNFFNKTLKTREEEETFFVLYNKSKFQADSNSHAVAIAEIIQHNRYKMKKKQINLWITSVKCNPMMWKYWQYSTCTHKAIRCSLPNIRRLNLHLFELTCRELNFYSFFRIMVYVSKGLQILSPLIK